MHVWRWGAVRGEGVLTTGAHEVWMIWRWRSGRRGGTG